MVVIFHRCTVAKDFHTKCNGLSSSNINIYSNPKRHAGLPGLKSLCNLRLRHSHENCVAINLMHKFLMVSHWL